MGSTHSLLFYILSGITLLGLLISAAIVSSAEAAFFSLSQQQILDCKTDKSNKSIIISKLIQQPNKLLSTLLILNNTISVAFIILSTYLLWQFFSPNPVPNSIMIIYTALSTAAIVLFSEIIPKTYATHNNLKTAQALAKFMHIVVKIMRPFSAILIWISNCFGKKVFQQDDELSIERLTKAVEITTDQVHSNEEKEILRGIVRFNLLIAKQIMQPRTHIVAIDLQANFYDVIQTVSQSGHARFPIYDRTIDHIVGLLYAKDLLPYLEKDKDYHWQGLIRKCLFVTENKKLDSLLLEFQESKIHMAIVVDEYGGTSGIITMEDVIEEIVGEIVDELDQEKQLLYKKIDDQTFEFESRILLRDFCKIVNIEPAIFEEIKGDSESLAGLLLEINKGLPKEGDKIVYKHFTFTILAADIRRIKKVKVHIGDKLEDNPITWL